MSWELRDSTTGEPGYQKSIDGSACVTTMPGGTVHIRESITLGTSPETFDFSATPIIAATIHCIPIATVTNENISAAVCIDPPTSAVRDAWLTAADSLSADVQRIPVFPSVPLELSFTAAVDYIGAKIDIGTDQECRVIIVGVEA
jgi:hypothetical protein